MLHGLTNSTGIVNMSPCDMSCKAISRDRCLNPFC